MRIVAVLLLSLLVTSPGWAAQPIVKDGDTIQLGDVTYRLAGVDAPEFDQPCIDDHADAWACGVDARDQLATLIGKREVRCEDLGEDKIYKNRRAGVCTIAGEPVSLNQAVVRSGFAVSSEPTAKVGFKEDELVARDKKQGLWKGCFVLPQEFRSQVKDGSLLGASCRSDKDRELRDGRGSPAMSGSTTRYSARVTRPSRNRTAGSAPRTTPGPRDTARRIIAGPAVPAGEIPCWHDWTSSPEPRSKKHLMDVAGRMARAYSSGRNREWM
jgi:endonuclease YncB( thermonuclease family)